MENWCYPAAARPIHRHICMVDIDAAVTLGLGPKRLNGVLSGVEQGALNIPTRRTEMSKQCTELSESAV